MAWDAAWVSSFRASHGGREPAEQDWQDHLLSLRAPGSGPGGSWTDGDWQTYYLLRETLGPELLAQIGRRGGLGVACYSGLGALLALWRLEPGPDGTRIAYARPFPRGGIPPDTGGWTWGNTIIIGEDERGDRPILEHEYVHVLQYRRKGILYAPSYLRHGLYNWAENPYEVQAVKVQGMYQAWPWLPAVWELPVVV